MSEASSPVRRWMIIRQGWLSPEERELLAEVAARGATQGRALVTVLLGAASYDAEQSDPAADDSSGQCWILENDARGRGIRPSSGRTVRVVSTDELVEGIMSAEKVIQFP